MLDLIKKTLGLGNESESINAPKKAKVELIASVLLLEAAHSDYECSEKEMEHVVETIVALFGIQDEHVSELMELAHSERKQAVDLHHFTRMANKNLRRDEKIDILEAVWRIIHADGHIDKYEEHYARKLTDLLRLDHRDFINAKLKAKK